MATIKKGLGRGLSALIPEQDMERLRQVVRGEGSKAAVSQEKSSRKNTDGKKQASAAPLIIVEEAPIVANQAADAPAPVIYNDNDAVVATRVAINSIEANPYQPRRFFQPEELSDLADSIREHNVLQPIIVRPLENVDKESSVRYQLVAGERRWRATQMAGRDTIPAIIRVIADQQALELALIENVQRHDISSVDAALAYRRLADEFGLSQENIAQRVGRSRSAVANTLRLLDLSEEIRSALEKGEISEGHGRAILLATGEGARRALYRRIIRDNLSVRETERLAKMSEEVIGEEKGTRTRDENTAPELKRIEAALQKRLGARVRLQARARGGRIAIEYSSVEELQRIIRSLGA
jgi:ParB family chromosome partitioning protein